MSAQELIYTLQLDDGTAVEARAADAESAERLRKAVKDPAPKRLWVKEAPAADTAGHVLANDALALSITIEGDVEGHTMTLRFPSAADAREFQKRLLITGVLAASLAVGAVGANAALQQQAQAVPQAGIGPAGRGLDGAVADQLVDGHPEDLGQGGQVAGRGLFGVALVVGDHPLRGADGLAELALAEAAGFADAT